MMIIFQINLQFRTKEPSIIVWTHILRQIRVRAFDVTIRAISRSDATHVALSNRRSAYAILLIASQLVRIGFLLLGFKNGRSCDQQQKKC